VILLTGATGYLGTLVLARLLDEPQGAQVLCPVRATDAEAARERMDAVLERIWFEPGRRRRARVLPVAADITGGLDHPAVRQVTHVLHCAAAVTFDQPLDDARAINVGGTRAVLDLAARAPRLERVVHVSTAYVAGRHAGPFLETQLDVGQRFRNTYEQTKFEAEQLVAARAAAGLPVAVARPSIVMGEAGTGWTTSFNVLYPPLRAYRRGLLREAPAARDGLLDIVTGDYVADGLLALLQAPQAEGAYHLVAGDGALTVREVGDLAADAFDRPAVELSSAATARAADGDGVFAPYFDVACRFDDRRARALLAQVGVTPTSAADEFGTLMRYADASLWGKRRPVREAVVARAA